MAKYDVFISCKSEDYKYAEEIYNFLNSQGIKTFLASKELRILGESEYRRAISKALKDTYHLIVFASNAEYIESTWVEYEWDMFVNAKLKGKKAGNIVTVLKDVDTDDLPMDLLKYQSFQYYDYTESILNYVETVESKQRRNELNEVSTINNPFDEKKDIYLCFKRKNINIANNLYYQLTKRGYRVYFNIPDLKERSSFPEQGLAHIIDAKDVLILLDQEALLSVKNNTYTDDRFCNELWFALKEVKNVIPILLNNYQMPPKSFFPDGLKGLCLKDSLNVEDSHNFGNFIDRLLLQITSIPRISETDEHGVFKFYSEEDCKVYADGKLIGDITGKSEEPFYFFVKRKGKYRFKANNNFTGTEIVITEQIDKDSEEIIDLKWPERGLASPETIEVKPLPLSEDKIEVKLGEFYFNMIRVEGGRLDIGATTEQIEYADANEYPAHSIQVKTFYMSEFPITQNLYKLVMGYDKSHFSDEYENVSMSGTTGVLAGGMIGLGFGPIIGAVSSAAGGWLAHKSKLKGLLTCKKHNPVETVSLLNAQEFCRRLSKMTNLKFSLPSEDEWEYAARGGQKSEGYIYAGSNDIDEVAWYRDNSEEKTHPVGLKKPNELGIYDMSGNVWEWTETKGHSYQDGSSDLGGTYYVRRGGSWWHEASNCRVSKRYMSDQNKKTKGLGFRIVMRIDSDNSKFRN